MSGVEVGIAVAEIGFSILSAGVGQAMEGDISVNRPGDDIGVIVESGRPDWLRRGTRRKSLELLRYRSSTPVGIEAVRFALNCEVQYNGLECQATFHVPADGNRSRLGTDTTVNIQNPLSLQELEAPQSWKDRGIMSYPVVFVPISLFVDEPWPNDNFKMSGNLVLSGMYGFGASGYGVWDNYQQWTD